MSPGKRCWVVAAGHIPVESTGPEPEFVSQDRVSLLNCGEREAMVELSIFQETRARCGPHRIPVKPRRVRRIRLGDLIKPQAIPLGTNYAILVTADEPIIVQFGRLDSSSRTAARFMTTAFPGE